MICIHHNKDMDGYSSGAIVKHRYPDAKLIGWDYKDPIPDLEPLAGEEVVMIDITFPVEKIEELSKICKHLTIIDHHISFKKDYCKYFNIESGNDSLEFEDIRPGLRYVYKLGVAACEIGWGYLFPEVPIPYAITLIGRYDTWRQNEGDWEGQTLPFKYFMYSTCNSAQTFPEWLFDPEASSKFLMYECITTGRAIMEYQRRMDESSTRNFSFEKIVYGGLKALCLNMAFFSSEVLRTRYDKEIHDIMIGFTFTGEKWSVSLRSDKPEVDVSVLAKLRGGGGHKGAAGFETKEFDKIFE